MAECLHFVITGEWVTQMARDQFWAEKKTYASVEQFLLSCMTGTNLPKATLQSYVRQVLMGKAKFIGRTDDESYRLTSDDTDITQVYPQYALFGPRLVEAILYSRIREEEGGEKPVSVYDYGWLDPQGDFYPVPWAEHISWALDYVQERCLKDFSKYRREHGPSMTDFTGAGDYLIYKLGWILLHSPGQGPAFETRDPLKRRTKAQTEFLFDYYIQRGQKEKAYALYKEGD
jgi:hypothetical protein